MAANAHDDAPGNAVFDKRRAWLAVWQIAGGAILDLTLAMARVRWWTVRVLTPMRRDACWATAQCNWHTAQTC
jgi:hypothetical protein